MKYYVTGSFFFIAGMTTAERVASSVAMQERCLPLCSEQSSDENLYEM